MKNRVRSKLADHRLVAALAGSLVIFAAPAHAERNAQFLNDRLASRGNRIDLAGARTQRMLRRQARSADFGSSTSFRHTTQVHNFASERSLRLDLSSNSRSITLGTKLFGDVSSIAVDIGNETQQFKPGDSVTAAEFVAINQKLTTGTQGLSLDNQGRAISGDVMLDSLRDGYRTIKADLLVVPEGVTGIGNLAKGGDFKLNGDLINHGLIVGLSRVEGADKARISADSIANHGRGVITTVLPSGMVLDNPDALASVDLLLKSSADITNSGKIESSGTLTLSAGGKIVNDSKNENAAVISARLDVNLDSSYVKNRGTILSERGDVNFSTGTPQDITLDNMGGYVAAPDGNINIRDVSTVEKVHTVIWGGDLHAQAVNINSGNGVVNVNARDIVGTINVNAGEAHVTAETENLALGQFNLTGDPTFYNSNGSITINSDLIFPGQNLAIVASGDIVTAAGAGVIDTSSAGSNAGSIFILAGAKITPSGSSLPPGPGDTTTLLTIDGGSETGGKVDLETGAPISAILAVSTFANGKGGDVGIGAFAGTSLGSGTVNLPFSSVIETAGDTSPSFPTDGTVEIYSSAVGGTAIKIGAVDTGGLGTGGVTGRGQVLIGTGGVNFTGTIQNGAITSGDFAVGPFERSSVVTSDITTVTSEVNIKGLDVLIKGSISTTGTLLSVNGAFIKIQTESATDFHIGSATTTNGVTGKLVAAGLAGTNGNGGQIQVLQLGTGKLILDAIDNVSVIDGGTGDGGQLRLQTSANSGALVIPVGDYTVESTPSGASGIIDFQANDIVFSGGPGKANLVAHAITLQTSI